MEDKLTLKKFEEASEIVKKVTLIQILFIVIILVIRQEIRFI